MEFNDELKALVDEVASRVDRWTAQSAWVWEPGSPASAEIANTEVRQDGTRWGDRPVRTAYAYAQMATKLAVEMSRCVALLIGAGRPAPGIEAETRAALEAGSVAWWLLEEKLSARSGCAACNCCVATAPASTPRASRKSARNQRWRARRRSPGSRPNAAPSGWPPSPRPGGCIRGRRSCRRPALSGLRPAHRAAGRPGHPAYAALARVADPASLPPAYTEVTQLDMFRDEDLAYALRLGQAGVPVEFHLRPGAPHEFDFIAFNTTAPAPSPTAFFRAPDAPAPHRWLPCSQP